MNVNVWRNPVFVVSAAIILLLVLLGAFFPVAFGEVSGLLYGWSTEYFGWFYLFAVFALVIFFSRTGDQQIRFDPLRRGKRKTGISVLHLDRNAFFCRIWRRACVLGCRGADESLFHITVSRSRGADG